MCFLNVLDFLARFGEIKSPSIWPEQIASLTTEASNLLDSLPLLRKYSIQCGLEGRCILQSVTGNWLHQDASRKPVLSHALFRGISISLNHPQLTNYSLRTMTTYFPVVHVFLPGYNAPVSPPPCMYVHHVYLFTMYAAEFRDSLNNVYLLYWSLTKKASRVWLACSTNCSLWDVGSRVYPLAWSRQWKWTLERRGFTYDILNCIVLWKVYLYHCHTIPSLYPL